MAIAIRFRIAFDKWHVKGEQKKKKTTTTRQKTLDQKKKTVAEMNEEPRNALHAI